MNALALLQTDVEAQAGLRESLRLLDLPPAWVVVLVVLPLFFFIAWIGYGREALSSGTRWVLSGLRVTALLLLFIVLARPVIVERREEVHPARVLVLLDDSASMRRRDAYSKDEDIRSALTRLVSSPEKATRLEIAQRVVDAELAPVLERGEYESVLYGFAETATPLTGTAGASGRGAGTNLGDALLQALASNRGRHVTDVVVLSDGRSNGGLDVAEAARIAGANGVPVHTLVIGDTRPQRNAIVELVEAPGDALEGDEVAVTVRVLGRGTGPEERARVQLEELDPSGDTPRILAEEEVALAAAGERLVLVAPPGQADLRTGERRFRVSLPPLPEETMVDDNFVEFGVHISPAAVRVLYVDGGPRWEYRYLKNLLLRADAKLEVQCFLLQANPDFPQESTAGLPSLQEVPATREELLENYDVVILGDVNPYGISADPARGDSFLTAVREFVEAGGGLLFSAGVYDNPRAFLQTPLEDLLPIEFDPLLTFEGDTRRDFHPLLADPKNPHEILRLHPEPETNRRLWEDADGLHGFYWYMPVRRAKPGTQTLLVHPTDTNPSDGEPYPLLVLGYFPAGRTMFLATDETWRWRYHYGDRYHERFWRNAIRWLALGRLKSGDRRFRLETTRSAYDLEERVSFEARVLDEDFQPSRRETQEVYWSGPESEREALELTLLGGREGVYRGSLQPERPGLHRAWIESNGQRVASVEFEVLLPSRENDEPAPDPETLAMLSQKTGGLALTLANLGRLSDEFPGGDERREPISSRLEDAWDRWATLLCALGVLSLEWILRKRAELL